MRRDATGTSTEVTRRLELVARELEGGEPWRVDDGPDGRGDGRGDGLGHGLGDGSSGTLPEEHGAGLGAELSGPLSGRPAVLPAGRHLRRQVGVEQRVGGWVEDRLPVPLRGRLHLGVREIALVVVVLAVGLTVAAVVVLRSGASEVATPAVAAGGPLLTPAAVPSGATAPTGTPASAASPTGTVVVDVAGRVRRPGVVTLPAGSRVVDALRRAGGARPHADLTSINLAAVLTDGQQIVVGAPASGTAPGATAAGAGPDGAGGAAGPLVDLNAASQDQLEALPGVGPVTAEKIMAWRTAHGAFSSLDELLEVDGIGPKTLAELAPHLTL